MTLDPVAAKRRRKAIERLEAKKAKWQDKLDKLDAKKKSGKLPVEKYNVKRVLCVRKIKGYDKESRKAKAALARGVA